MRYFRQILLLVFTTGVFLGLICTEIALAQSPSDEIGPYLDRAMDQVTEFRLKNGMRFIVMEQHQAPVVSFLTYADVGGVDEPDGQTGVAHYLEHLAFKGTQHIGTTDYDAERVKLEKLDHIFDQMQALKGSPDADAIQQRVQLLGEFKRLQDEAAQYVISNQYGQIVQQAGGVGVNATTSAEATRYFYSFPANKLELWMSLESERFLEPVFRDFYQEKSVILEERRLRTENSPTGQLFDAFLAKTFREHPYRRPVIGYEADIQNLTRANVQDFFDHHYIPSQLTTVIVGDVQPSEVKRLAEIYFGRYHPRPFQPTDPQPEPPQTRLRQVNLKLPSQPWYLEGYPCPPLKDPDYLAYEMLSRILSDGRTSRLYKSLVLEQGIALNAQTYLGFPGNKYPNRFIFYALTSPGHSLDQVATAIHAEIARLQRSPVSEAELDQLKTRARMELLQALMSNEGIARLLAEYAVKTGDWRNIFTKLEAIAQVTPADIQRVAQTLKASQRTVAQILPES